MASASSRKAKAGARKSTCQQPAKIVRDASHPQIIHEEHGGTLPPLCSKESVQHGRGRSHGLPPGPCLTEIGGASHCLSQLPSNSGMYHC